MRNVNVKLIAADYHASNKESFLAYLDAVSGSRKDGGLLHGGHIHYIQSKLSEENQFCFLKAAIKLILDCVPKVFPIDLPEQIESGRVTGLTKEQTEKMREIQSQLILPVYPADIVRVISAAREYLECVKEEHQ